MGLQNKSFSSPLSAHFLFLLPTRAGSKGLKWCLGRELISCVVATRQKVTTAEGPDPDTCLWSLGRAKTALAFLARLPASQAGEAWLINSLPSKSDAKALLSAGLRKSSYQISKMQLDLQVSSEI